MLNHPWITMLTAPWQAGLQTKSPIWEVIEEGDLSVRWLVLLDSWNKCHEPYWTDISKEEIEEAKVKKSQWRWRWVSGFYNCIEWKRLARTIVSSNQRHSSILYRHDCFQSEIFEGHKLSIDTERVARWRSSKENQPSARCEVKRNTLPDNNWCMQAKSGYSKRR